MNILRSRSRSHQLAKSPRGARSEVLGSRFSVLGSFGSRFLAGGSGSRFSVVDSRSGGAFGSPSGSGFTGFFRRHGSSPLAAQSLKYAVRFVFEPMQRFERRHIRSKPSASM